MYLGRYLNNDADPVKGQSSVEELTKVEESTQVPK